jgi:hypothetical protein
MNASTYKSVGRTRDKGHAWRTVLDELGRARDAVAAHGRLVEAVGHRLGRQAGGRVDAHLGQGKAQENSDGTGQDHPEMEDHRQTGEAEMEVGD